ncbi:Rrf2 family transcriptional regulator [Paenibacillus sediminis]|uniref:Rrf2 family protein n=1 Tax=Paenibacillus sediminis TaxID=664909 RepID=A0ABS4H308_9BACL|nr:Rrf2 family transcriptional regulator [Paenibacillus sediminis]MBP1936903.1 Rrf2 family protein [Paenibacillus sediminis]
MNSELTIAIHCLIWLSMHTDQMANSDTIAQSVATHPARVRKVLSILRKNGYVVTKEGTGGGYMLSCNIDEVSLGDLYRLLARGSLQPHWCSGDSEQNCKVSAHMQNVMNEVYGDAERSLENHLDTVKVSDVKEKIEREHLLKSEA